MVQENHMQVHFDAKSVNEGLARMVVTAFMTNMNPTLEQIADVKTAVSEAVTNAIIHGYEDETKQVELTCDQNGQQLVVTVEDHGVGIEDLEQALQPFFTTKPELERSGMGFSFMEAFMDRIEVRSKKGEGTRVVMWKYIEREREQYDTGKRGKWTTEHPEGAAGRPEDQAADDNREYGAGLYGGETICKPGN